MRILPHPRNRTYTLARRAAHRYRRLSGKELSDIAEGLELERVSGGVEDEERRLLARGALEANARLDDPLHLARLKAAGLIRVVAQGKHRYHSLSGSDVAKVLRQSGRPVLVAANKVDSGRVEAAASERLDFA